MLIPLQQETIKSKFGTCESLVCFFLVWNIFRKRVLLFFSLRPPSKTWCNLKHLIHQLYYPTSCDLTLLPHSLQLWVVVIVREAVSVTVQDQGSPHPLHWNQHTSLLHSGVHHLCHLTFGRRKTQQIKWFWLQLSDDNHCVLVVCIPNHVQPYCLQMGQKPLITFWKGENLFGKGRRLHTLSWFEGKGLIRYKGKRLGLPSPWMVSSEADGEQWPCICPRVLPDICIYM